MRRKGIIFLDNDGVICLRKNRIARGSSSGLGLDDFDRECVSALNRILAKTGADYVVSSDWRLYVNFEKLADHYTNQGVIKKPIGLTRGASLKEGDPRDTSLTNLRLAKNRIVEIEDWLNSNPDVKRWVAVDDLNLGIPGGLKRFVRTNENVGLKDPSVIDKIQNLLI